MSTSPTTEQQVRASFDLNCNLRDGWVWKADGLHKVVELSLPHDPFRRRANGQIPSDQPFDESEMGCSLIRDTIYMLEAMSLECLLKALWVACGKELANNGKVRQLRGHDLLCIAERIEKETSVITFNSEEKQLFNELTKYIEAGRYPVPTNVFKDAHCQFGFLQPSPYGSGWLCDQGPNMPWADLAYGRLRERLIEVIRRQPQTEREKKLFT